MNTTHNFVSTRNTEIVVATAPYWVTIRLQMNGGAAAFCFTGVRWKYCSLVLQMTRFSSCEKSIVYLERDAR